MINPSIQKELEKKKKGHIIFENQLASDMRELPSLIKEPIVEIPPEEWYYVTDLTVVDEYGNVADKAYKIEVVRKYLATKILASLEKRHPELQKYEGSNFLPIFLKGDREEYARKKNYIYGLKDVEDILGIEGIQEDRIHFLINNTGSNLLCDSLSILLSDDTPFSVSFYLCPSGFSTYYIPDSKEKIHLQCAYNYTVYKRSDFVRQNRVRKGKQKKKSDEKV